MAISTSGNLAARIAALSPEKRALLERKLRQQGRHEATVAEIPRRGTHDAPPLSYAQQRLWFLQQLSLHPALYHISLALRLHGPLNLTALQQAMDALVARHESLRTTFPSRDGEPRQLIADQLRIPIPLIDLSTLPAMQRESEALRQATETAQRPFDLTCGPLLRPVVFQLGPEDSLFDLTSHHIITDGWSQSVLIEELSALYTAFVNGDPPSLPVLPLQYADFAVWQRLQEESTHLSYWKKHLASAPPLLQLPTDHPRPVQQSYRGARFTFYIAPALTTALRRFSQQEGVTLFMTLIAAFQVLLARHTGENDIVVGSPIAGRVRPELEALIGLFVNTIVIRTNVSNSHTFRALLHHVQDTALDAYAHQELPFEKMVDELHVPRTLGHAPLVQVLFALQNVPRSSLQFPGITTTAVTIPSGAARVDLNVMMWDDTHELRGEVEYSTDIFAETTIARLAEHYQVLLEGMIAHPDQPIATLPLLTSREKHQLLVEWSASQAPNPSDLCVHQLFAAQAERTPDTIALIYENQHLTYRELNTRANQLAHALRRMGASPETCVGVCVERSLDMAVAILGILKAGSAYVPLDPSYPSERIRFMCNDARVAMILTQQTLCSRLAAYSARLLCLDSDWSTIAHEAHDIPPATVTATSLAYVMYTSGSTGQPKGVMIPHRGIVRLVNNTNYTHFGPDERVLQLAPMTFDASTFELWGPLLHGGCCVLFPGAQPTPHELARILRSQRITTLWLTASLFNLLIDDAPEILSELRQLLIGGEALSVPHVRRALAALPRTQIINGYGPTENTTFTCCYVIPPSLPTNILSIPIGRPIANTHVYILDQNLQPLPIGVTGELYIGGEGLAQGYLNQPELTAERFIAHPFNGEPGARLYKTGDMARYLPDGNIEFVGRRDHQVKLHGFRIELGEIETLLERHPSVQHAVVLLQEERPGDKRLVAYVSPISGRQITQSELHLFIRHHLPDYLVPAAVVVLTALPLTTSGKVDRSALPMPENTSGVTPSFVAPQGTLEIQLTKIWEHVLGRSPIGITDNFFDVGGNSLLVIRAISQIRKVVKIEVPVAVFFHNPTVKQLADFFRQQRWQTPTSRFVPLQQHGSLPPFFCISGWVALARYVAPEQPFYMARGFGYDGERAPATIEDLACAYLKEIQTLQPKGPYFLGGHSYGGLVAFDIAQRLLRQGHPVALLALLDPSSARQNQSQHSMGTLPTTWAYRLSKLLPFHPQYHWARLKERSHRQQLVYLGEQIQGKLTSKLHVLLSHVYLTLNRSVPLRFRPAYAFHLLQQAVGKYRPDIYPGRAVLFQTKQWYPEYQHHWQRLCPQGLDIHVVPGSHVDMFADDHLREWAPLFAELLQQAQKEYAADAVSHAVSAVSR